MKKIISILSGLVLTFVFVTTVSAAKPTNTCATIQGGTITDTASQLITLGYDQWGYNYEANMFNGLYDNYTRPTVPATDGDRLMMKWNNAWLSNRDCNHDGKLDRHFGFNTYRGSGAWLTNHASGTYQSTVSGHWDIAGDWVITVNGVYNHDYTFTMTSLPDGTFTGVGGYPASALDYTFDEVVINGQVTGNTVSFTATYYVSGVPTGYSWNATGEIDASGHFVNGTGTSGVSEWHSTSGVATKVMDMCTWSDFVKIVAVPEDAISTPTTECPALYGLDEQMWSTADGTEIGCSVWSEFAVIQDVYSDPCGEKEYAQSYHSPLKSGLGNW